MTKIACATCGAKHFNHGRNLGNFSWAIDPITGKFYCLDCAAEREVKAFERTGVIVGYVHEKNMTLTTMPGREIGKILTIGEMSDSGYGHHWRRYVTAQVAGFEVFGWWHLSGMNTGYVKLKKYKKGVAVNTGGKAPSFDKNDKHRKTFVRVKGEIIG